MRLDQKFVLFVSVFAIFTSFSLYSQQISSGKGNFDSNNTAFAADRPLSALELRYNWRIQRGDFVRINLSTNTLHLVRADYSHISAGIPVGSGIQGMVNWLGMTYDATTPEEEWMILSKNQQNVWWVFGSKAAHEQLFLRLYRRNIAGDGYEYSRYGIHTTPNIDVILANGGYGSYGCILTEYDFLKLLEEVFDMQQEHGEGLRVSTYWE